MPAAFRLYSKMEPQWGSSGQLLAGGYLKFYTAGTTDDEKDVFGEIGLSTNNGNTVTLDAAGRPSVDVWGSGSYFVELYDADDVKQSEADYVQIPGGEATALPSLEPDKVLTNDGSVMSWEEFREVPDPTGQADKVLSSDGTTLTWIAKPTDGADGTSDVAQTSTSFTVLDLKKQFGSATATATGGTSCSKAVTFPTAYTTCLHVGITITNGPASGGPIVHYFNAPASTTGFTVVFDVAEGSGASSAITSDVNFTWEASGIIP